MYLCIGEICQAGRKHSWVVWARTSPFPEGGLAPCVGLLPRPQIHHERLVVPGEDVEGYVLFK